jgi:hypothetical protein
MTSVRRYVKISQPEEVDEVKASQPAQPIVVDAYQGQGGSYILDSTTGVRTPVQDTKPENQEVISDGTSDS